MRAGPSKFGAAVIMLVALVVLALLAAMWTNAEFYAQVLAWQTLIAGGLAILAALIGGSYIQDQIAVAERHEQDRLRRSFAAARALLPLTLSQISEYAKATAGELETTYHKRDGQRIPKLPEVSFPTLPGGVVDQLREVIGAADETTAGVLSDLVAKVQIQRSRVRDAEAAIRRGGSQLVIATNIESYIVDAAEIYARASSLFPFARREVASPPQDVCADEVASALFQILRSPEMIDGIYDRVDRAGFASRPTAQAVADPDCPGEHS